MPDVGISTNRISVVGAAQSEVVDVFGATMAIRSDGSTNGLFVAEQFAPPGYFVPPHIHDVDDEAFFLLAGTLTLLDGTGGETRVGPGTYVDLPKGVRHGFRNDTDAEIRFVVLCRPGVQAAEMFRHFDRAVRAAPGGLTPPEIVAIAGEYGVRM
jgi:quercetin dioxygenase-like cupin family protein